MTNNKLTNKIQRSTEVTTNQYSKILQQQKTTVEVDVVKVTHIKSVLLANQLKLNPENIARAILKFHIHSHVKSEHD